MTNFREIIQQLPPEHDHPAGLIHPYWARKPLNIVEAIICYYSKEGDTIADPFMGSGTSIIAAIKNNRNVIGSDLSPISKLLVEAIINSAKSPSNYKKILQTAVNDWTQFSFLLYTTSCGKCVERETFLVNGEYKNRQFSLQFERAKIKPIKNNELKGKVENLDVVKYYNNLNKEYIHNPIDFSKIDFIENTRIAVHAGSKASDFFTERNIIFINYAHQYINNNLTLQKEVDFMKLFLSSMIPMIRLSDKKASSQWPYWRPKKHLTSRNPIVAIKRRYKAFTEFLNWEEGALNNSKLNIQIYHTSAKQLSNHCKQQVDLIVTDPPYADHVPYMEYSDLYWSIINGERTDHLWNQEIVKTNAVGRQNDSQEYELRMFNSFCSILSLLKNEGYFVFFYLDKNIYHWESIKSALKTSGCIIEDVIGIPKQRRSMKTVTSPGKTLDGDLMIICKKVQSESTKSSKILMKEVLDTMDGKTYFEKFTLFIKQYLINDIIDLSDWNLKDISRVL